MKRSFGDDEPRTVDVLAAAFQDPGSGTADRDLMRDGAGGPTPGAPPVPSTPAELTAGRKQPSMKRSRRNAIGKRNNAILTASFERMGADGSA